MKFVKHITKAFRDREIPIQGLMEQWKRIKRIKETGTIRMERDKEKGKEID